MYHNDQLHLSCISLMLVVSTKCERQAANSACDTIFTYRWINLIGSLFIIPSEGLVKQHTLSFPYMNEQIYLMGKTRLCSTQFNLIHFKDGIDVNCWYRFGEYPSSYNGWTSNATETKARTCIIITIGTCLFVNTVEFPILKTKYILF